MDLQEATIKMASLMKGESDFYKEHLEGLQPNTPEEILRYKTAVKEFEWLQSNTLEFGNTLAANPNFFDVLESWRVVISGTDTVDRGHIYEAKDSNNVEGLLERCGSLATSIKGYIKKKGWMICDMSAGEDGWDIAVRCTEKNSRLICEEYYQKYIVAFNQGLLSISRRFSKHSLPGLYNWKDAIKILKTINL